MTKHPDLPARPGGAIYRVTAADDWNPLITRVNTHDADIDTATTALSGKATTAALNAETTARQNADTALQTSLTNEASTRASANTALGNRATALENARAKFSKIKSTAPLTVTAPTSGTQTPVDIPGTATTFTVSQANNRVLIAANLDCQISGAPFPTPGGSGALVIECVVDGTVQPEQVLFIPGAPFRGTSGQTWVATVSAGSHTVKLTARALAQSSPPSYAINTPHSGYTLAVVDNA